ncbi:MAG TPA: prepilin-type N-terminal cleavage/methylation domain-containing protein [Acidobacteriota bacterium]|nr:prepilin-type N-terminal cleavage/methylation domain-containing protein [Acidobacteriota bacterium]
MLTSCRGDQSEATKGFSLLELVIVLVLLALASALVAPSFTTGLGGLQLETSARDVITLMRHARSQAIGKQEVFRVILGEQDPLSLKYFLANEFGETIKEQSLPDGFRFEVPDNWQLPMVVSFYPNGRSSGAVFGVRSGQGKTKIIAVDVITGFARLQKETRPQT